MQTVKVYDRTIRLLNYSGNSARDQKYIRADWKHDRIVASMNAEGRASYARQLHI